MVRPSRIMEHLEEHEIDMLATYNSEVARGLIHNMGWQQRMAELQRRFNLEHPPCTPH